MHISEGVLRPEILAAGAIVGAAWIGTLFYKLEARQIPRVAAFSALFFTASFIHVPVGATSAHLVLSGLIGAFLGAQAILAVFIGLLFQGLFFGYGGVSALGVNTLIIGAPAILGRYFFKFYAAKGQKFWLFLAGFAPILASALLLSTVLALNGEQFYAVAALALASNAVLSAVEGAISLFVLKFILRVNKGLLA